MEFKVEILLYDSDSKFFFLFLELLFTFSLIFFLELLFTFYFFFTFLFQNCFLLFTFSGTTIFLFFYLCPIPCVYSNQQSTAFATIY